MGPRLGWGELPPAPQPALCVCVWKSREKWGVEKKKLLWQVRLKWPWVGAEGTRGAGGFATLLGAVGVGVRLVQLLEAEHGAEKCLNLSKT